MTELETWQPIETAPRDGSELIIFDRDGSVRVARYSPLAWSEATKRAMQWYIALEKSEHSGGTYAMAPTHWMPLPAPPEAT